MDYWFITLNLGIDQLFFSEVAAAEILQTLENINTDILKDSMI